TYFIIALEDDPTTAVDESHYVQLANSERAAIDEEPIDLRSPEETVVDASDIQNDTITFHATPGQVFNPIELGQAVIYREPGRTDDDKVVDGPNGYKVWQSPNVAIDGTRYIPLVGGADGLAKGGDYYLEHGGLYYVMAGRNQFNLIGDQRLVSSQDIQLG